MKFKKSILVGTILLGITPLSFGQIANTAHDFTLSRAHWNLANEMCNVCHAPHNTDVSQAHNPLWIHTTTQANYTLYTGYTFSTKGGVGQQYGTPDGSSKLCLSCHDGTVAINSVNGAVLDTIGGKFGSVMMGTTHLNSTISPTTGLAGSHPISFVYDQNLVGKDPLLNNPLTTITPSGNGVTIAKELLDANGKVQCTSCHDPHLNTTTNWKYVRYNNNVGSQLCLVCHNK